MTIRVKPLISSAITIWMIAYCPTASSFSSTASLTRSKVGGYNDVTTSAPFMMPTIRTTTNLSSSKSSQEKNKNAVNDIDAHMKRRRSFVTSVTKATTALLIAGVMWSNHPSITNASDKQQQLPSLLTQVKEAKDQLSPIPTLIQEEKWDAVRAILITPPLSDCWAKSSASKPLLKNIASAIGDELPDGDELAALELREDLTSHLRFLDMAVYNNVFNPIGTEGKTGATKELIRSYYEDPVNEYKATLKAFEELIQLAAAN